MKHMRLFKGVRFIDWIVQSYRAITKIPIVICTPSEEWPEVKGATIFRYGLDPDNVVDRLASAAYVYGADICIMHSGDCPEVPTAEELKGYIERVKKSNKTLVAEYEGILISPFNHWWWAVTDEEDKKNQFPGLLASDRTVVMKKKYKEKRSVDYLDDLINMRGKL